MAMGSGVSSLLDVAITRTVARRTTMHPLGLYLAMFISEKTASVHVTHAMDTLGALSRYEAAATATRLGLLEPAEVP
jgi:hypothetical protein